MNDKIRLVVDDTGPTVVYNPTCYPVKRPPPKPNKLACWVKFTFITFATLLILGVYSKPWIFAQIEDFRNRQAEAQKTNQIELNDGGYRNEEFVLNSKILIGTNENFDDLVSNDRKLVLFYAPCKYITSK